MLIECSACHSHFVVGGEGKHNCPVCENVCQIGEDAQPPASAWGDPKPPTPVPLKEGILDAIDAPAPPASRLKRLSGQCAIHPANRAEGTCTRCGNFLCPECRGMIEHEAFCAPCYYKIDAETKYVAWEDPELPFFGRLIATGKECMFNPTEFFDKLPLTGGAKQPLIFATICMGVSTLSIILIQLFVLLSSGVSHGMSSSARPFLLAIMLGYFVGVIVVLPLAVIAGMYIGTAIFHTCLRLFGGGQEGFEATLRALCYSFAPYLLSVIPLCGFYLGSIWQFGLQVYGAKRVHNMSFGSVLLAVFLPMFVMILLLSFFVAGFAMISGR